MKPSQYIEMHIEQSMSARAKRAPFPGGGHREPPVATSDHRTAEPSNGSESFFPHVFSVEQCSPLKNGEPAERAKVA